ncbi:kunitz/BPTI-like toxin [Zophobas morio]|uniref:kunitz/BPTI-like toxin n=1 Tax=Zophobas morio TaxID=2755281 RepID=UPI0030831556
MLVFILPLVASLNIISVNPTFFPKIICHLPEDPGPCQALSIRWSYDSRRKDCYKFKYGGCHGNENNFVAYRPCMYKCYGVGGVGNGRVTNDVVENGTVHPGVNIPDFVENGRTKGSRNRLKNLTWSLGRHRQW